MKGIRNWHEIIIDQDGNGIMVRNDVNGEFRDIPVLKENVIFEEFLKRIEPESFSSNYHEELLFFKQFVTKDHKKFMDYNYE